jgi:hypothetical protein
MADAGRDGILNGLAIPAKIDGGGLAKAGDGIVVMR